MQASQIAVVEQPTQHVRRDLPCAFRVELVARHEGKTAIEAIERDFEPGLQEIGRVDQHHAGGAAMRAAVGQPKERHQVNLARSTGRREGGIVPGWSSCVLNAG